MLCTSHKAASGSSEPTASSPCASASDVCAPCVSARPERAVCVRVCFAWAAAGCALSARAWCDSAPRDLVEACGSWFCSFPAFLMRVFWSDERSPFPLLVSQLFPSLIASRPFSLSLFRLLNTCCTSRDIPTANQVLQYDSLPLSASHFPLLPFINAVLLAH